ncbi:unnamed protein product [Lactuca saligna]|uniref:Pectin acetylesterase n=1 Tax=Lactuca saligna TaxID=75948 RepID=A0AA36E981_LACSI|nr:unnamed protein product [Lactuca saligna]
MINRTHPHSFCYLLKLIFFHSTASNSKSSQLTSSRAFAEKKAKSSGAKAGNKKARPKSKVDVEQSRNRKRLLVPPSMMQLMMSYRMKETGGASSMKMSVILNAIQFNLLNGHLHGRITIWTQPSHHDITKERAIAERFWWSLMVGVDWWDAIACTQSAAEDGIDCLDGNIPAYHFQKGFGSGSRRWALHIEVKIRYCDGASFAGHPESEQKVCSFLEDTKEQSDSDALENNPQYRLGVEFG